MGEYSKALAEEVNQLKAELAEARAQIAARDMEIARLRTLIWPKEPTEYVSADLLAEARAQIAAKDAMLLHILDPFEELPSDADGGTVHWHDIANAIDEVRRRLTAPARETKQ